MLNVECNEMSPLHSSRLKSSQCTLGHSPIVQKQGAQQKCSTYIIFTVLNNLPAQKKHRTKCARRVSFSFRARRGDKQRSKWLLLLWLCIICFVRWPTVEMSCNYSHSYFPPSLFSVAIVIQFFTLLLRTKNKHAQTGYCKMLARWNKRPVQCSLFLFLLLLYFVHSVRVWRGGRPLEGIWCDKSVSFFGHITMPVIYFFPFRLFFVSFGWAWTVSLGLP